MRKFRILVITIVFFAISCKKPIDVSPDTPENDAVNVSLPSLINSFQIEANKRKINVDVNSISVKIKKGLGGAGLWVPTEKTIYLDEDIWNDFDNLEKEVLLFHELGHALLNRGHNNFRLKNGEFASIMRAGDANKVEGVDYQSDKKKYYLDELFNEKTPLPNWSNYYKYDSNVTENNKILKFEENFNNNSNNWSTSESDGTTVSNGIYSIKSTTKSKLLNIPFKVDTTQNFDLEFEIKTLGEGSASFYFGEINRKTSIALNINPSIKSVVFDIDGFKNFGLDLIFENIKQNNFNNIKIRKEANKTSIFVNDVFVYSWKQRRQFEKPLWFVNFLNSGVEYQLDNFKYYTIK